MVFFQKKDIQTLLMKKISHNRLQENLKGEKKTFSIYIDKVLVITIQ